MAMNTIMGMFAKSPITPLQEHADTVNDCCDLLLPFFEATHASNWPQAIEVRDQISQLEKSADALKRDIRMKLPRGIFLAVNRTDMLELVTQQDKLANLAKDISGRTIGRKLRIPDSIYPHFVRYVERCLDAAKQSRQAIQNLDELLETGFKGREVEIIVELVQELDRIEDDTDVMQINLRQQFMAIEKDYNPIDMMFLYENLKWVGGIADQAQRVGSRLEIMLSRS